MGKRKKPIAAAGAPHSLFRRMTRRRPAAPPAGADHKAGNGIRELLAFLGWLARDTLAFVGWLCGGALAFVLWLGGSALAFLGRLGGSALALLRWLGGGASAFLGRLRRDMLAFLGWLWDGAVGFAKHGPTGWVSFMAWPRAEWQWWWRRCRENGLRVKGDEEWPVHRPSNLEPRGRTGNPSEKSD